MVAFVGFLACVYSHMYFQNVISAKTLFTMVALVGFLVIVSSLVFTATSTVVQRWFVDTPLAIHCESFTADCSRTHM